MPFAFTWLCLADTISSVLYSLPWHSLSFPHQNIVCLSRSMLCFIFSRQLSPLPKASSPWVGGSFIGKLSWCGFNSQGKCGKATNEYINGGGAIYSPLSQSIKIKTKQQQKNPKSFLFCTFHRIPLILLIYFCAHFILKCKLYAGKDCIIHLLDIYLTNQIFLAHVIWRHCARLWWGCIWIKQDSFQVLSWGWWQVLKSLRGEENKSALYVCRAVKFKRRRNLMWLMKLEKDLSMSYLLVELFWGRYWQGDIVKVKCCWINR